MPAVFTAATMPGDPGKPNEDLPGVLGDCAVLLDGSGAPGDLPTGCIHGVPWFVRQLGSRCLGRMAGSAPRTSLDSILETVIAEVMGLHRDTCDLSVPGTPSSMIVMVRAGQETVDYLVLGDSALIIDVADDVTMVTDTRMADVAPPEYQQVLSLPTGTPEHQAARMAFVAKQQPLRNSPHGYPVVSTDPAAARKAITGSLPARDVRRAALVSDGVTRYAEFGLGTWKDLLDVLGAAGPGALFECIRRAEASDPAGHRWARAKRHDDVAAVYMKGTSS